MFIYWIILREHIKSAIGIVIIIISFSGKVALFKQINRQINPFKQIMMAKFLVFSVTKTMNRWKHSE